MFVDIILSVWQYGSINCAYVVSCYTLLKHKWLLALLQQRLRDLFRSREWSCEILRSMRAISKQEMKTWQVQDKLAQTKLRHIKHDYFMNFYISLEKRENSQYLCNSKRDLHII